MTTLFVSDLHLSPDRPRQVELFLKFLAQAQMRADALYILGDLFEMWLGDDDDTSPHKQIVDALGAISRAGVKLHVGHGNRDFLLGQRFARRTGATLLQDYEIIDLYGERTLLTHGDLLCTKDIKYQRFRKFVRSPLVRAAFLRIPLSLRRRIAFKTQSGTKASMRTKTNFVMDVDDDTVSNMMMKYKVKFLIHGHTHRPDIHDFHVDGAAYRRIVLGDWYEQDYVLVCDKNGARPTRVTEYLRKTA